MGSFAEFMDEYRKQLEVGAIQQAYRGLMQYMMDLRTYFDHKYPDYVVSGSIYYGYMDMTYFSFSPESLRKRKLKVAIVFIHGLFRFEAWLAGVNKQVQASYWKKFKENDWNKHRLVPDPQGVDAILEATLVDPPVFADLGKLTSQIEIATLRFIEDVERFLNAHPGSV